MRLKELRKQTGKQQKGVAEELKIPVSTYAGYERNEREPNIATLIKLADYFDVSVDYLIGHEKTSNHCTGQTLG